MQPPLDQPEAPQTQNEPPAQTWPSITAPPPAPLPEAAATLSSPAPTATVESEPRNLLAALLLTLSFGTTGLHQLYLGRKKQAWIRFGLLLSILPLGVLVFILPIFALLSLIWGIIIVPILFVWGILDIFKVYLKKVDGEGNALATSPRDTKTAKIIFIATIVINAIIPILVIISTVLSISTYQQSQERARESMERQNQLNQQRLDQFKRSSNPFPQSYQQ